MLSIFEKFGGIRPMAEKVGVPSSTVKTWHRKRSIPEWRIDRVLEAAAAHDINVERDEVENIVPDSAPLRRGAPSAAPAAEAA